MHSIYCLSILVVVIVIMYQFFRYNSSITDSGDASTIECLPDLVGIIDSHNATAVLANRGTAYVDPLDHLVALDNRLRPYHFQTHAG